MAVVESDDVECLYTPHRYAHTILQLTSRVATLPLRETEPPRAKEERRVRFNCKAANSY